MVTYPPPYPLVLYQLAQLQRRIDIRDLTQELTQRERRIFWRPLT